MRALIKNFGNQFNVIYAILLIALLFLSQSVQYSFGWFNFFNNDNTIKLINNKKSINEKKFKFHKLERIEIFDNNYFNDTNEYNDSNNDYDDNNEENKINDNIEILTDQTNDNDNIGNDDDVRTDDYHFEKVRLAQKISSLTNKQKIKDDRHNNDYENDIDNDNDIMSSLLNWLFDKNETVNDQINKNQNIKHNNHIIEWLTRFKALFNQSTENSKEDIFQSLNWLHYFNRWPFNRLFHISKSFKYTKLWKFSEIYDDDDDDGDDDDDDDDDDDKNNNKNNNKENDNDEIFIQKDFLLYHLPSFIINPNQFEQYNNCQQQLLQLREDLQKRKLWTFQMLDANAKLTSGLLRGNINQFGDFTMCTDIKSNTKITTKQSTQLNIRGKYCLAHIEIQYSEPELRIPIHMLHGRGLFNSHLENPSHFMPRYGIINLGICLPHLCPATVVQQTVTTHLESYNLTGLTLRVEVEESNDCFVKYKRPILKIMSKDKKFCTTLLFMIVITLLPISISIWEYRFTIKIKSIFLLKWLINHGFNLLTIIKRIKNENIETKIEKKSEIYQEHIKMTRENCQNNEDLTADNLTIPDEVNFENVTNNSLIFEIFKTYSIIRNIKILFIDEKESMSSELSKLLLNSFPFIHVLKIGSTFMLYLCLKFIMLGHLPIINRNEMVRYFEHPWSVCLRHPMLYADILLFINGFFTAYQLSAEMECKSYIPLLKIISLKITRYLPMIYMAISFQTWILPYLNSGPLWTNLIGHNAHLCENHWWRNLLNIQNILNFDEICAPTTVQLALEVQLLLLGSLVIWLFYCEPEIGFFVYGCLHAISVAIRYSITNREHLSVILFHGINISKFYRTATYIYGSPLCRATTYLLGLGAGIFQITHKGNLHLTKELITLGWILTGFGLFWSLGSPSSAMRNSYVYSSIEAASYASWSPLIFGLCICWCFFMLPKCENYTLRFFVTSKPIRIISRLMIPVQLVMYIIILYNTASFKEPTVFQLNNLINIFEIIVILLIGLVITLLLDIPFQHIRYIIINRLFMERISVEIDDNNFSGIEYSDVSEKIADNITTEPLESIWNLDGDDEEEQRFFARRASSLKTSSLYSNINDKPNEIIDNPKDCE